MLEIPALAPAILAWGCLWYGPTRWHAREVISGILLGLALLIKLVPGILLPLVLLTLYLRDRNVQRSDRAVMPTRPRARKSDARAGAKLFAALPRSSGDRSGLGRFLLNAAVCAASAGFTLVVMDLLIEGGGFLSHFGQTWGSHFGPRRSFEYGSPADHPFEWSLLLKNWDLTLPAAVGVIFGFRRRHLAPAVLFPGAWLGWMLVVFDQRR
jgi:hypothetical protein